MVEQILSYLPKLLPYLFVTLEYVAFSLLFGSLLAALLTSAKLSRFRILRGLAFGFTTIMRCTPSIILLFLVFYGLPPLVRGVFGIDIEHWDVVVFVSTTFTLFLGASLSELARSAFQSVDSGQSEAAACVGMNRAQALRRIIVPQVFYLMLPNMGNTLQFLIKEGSLAYMIGLIDIMGRAFIMNSTSMGAHVLEIYLALALVFWVLSLAIERGFSLLEQRLQAGYGKRGKRGTAP
ncbi:MAG: amino acid ABC transporter permease [Coriobacteriaceae bacterium]|jgi:L-cystine transport system permease protein|nr:amino acid ABC transporter permease [Coriobacteriaceae bacterium]